jgi:hypothetical protein
LAIGRIEYALKDAGGAVRGGVVKIGIFFFICLWLGYQAQNPFVHLIFVEGGSAEHVAAVQHHRRDLAFLTDEPAWLRDCASVGRAGYLLSSRKVTP